MSKLVVLIVGSGGREHALAWRLSVSESVASVVVTPGNAGTERSPDGKLSSRAGDPLEVARELRPDLIVIGPEVPLCAGITDELAALGFSVFGPSKAAARLEGSKAFTKELASRAGIPTAAYRIVTDVRELDSALSAFSAPPVVKADGLCAGKGVVVADSFEEARAAAESMLDGSSFGDAGRTLVLEERLLGNEASVHVISDGTRFAILPTAQDHKRIGDGDTGPNTGGMGTYAPAPLMHPALLERVKREIIEPALSRLAQDGTPFRGALFAGLMITPAGEPQLIEFNVRFGDPETEVLMSILDGDLGRVLHGAARGELDPALISSTAEHAVCVVLASHGYPGKVRTGDAITGIEQAESLDGVRVFHAGTKREGDKLVTSGGRVLAVTARAGSLRQAQQLAYRAVEKIHFDGMQYRRDIGARALCP